MSLFLRRVMTIARRDFMALVATPTFLLFLLAPMLMVATGVVGGMGASSLATNAEADQRIVVLAPPGASPDAIMGADARVRALFDDVSAATPPAATGGTDLSGESEPIKDPLATSRFSTPRLTVLPDPVDPAARATLVAQLWADKSVDTRAIMVGPFDAPTITARNTNGTSVRFLAALGREIVNPTLPNSPPAATVTAAPDTAIGGKGPRLMLGFAAVFVVFLLTLLLASQAVGMLAEEKSNKVIEILASAVPLESVFVGKLVGLYGVAILFIAFWAVMAVVGGTIAGVSMLGDPATAAAVAQAQSQASAAGAQAALNALTPAIGWPLFLLLGFAYFTMAFLLLGAVFLGIGAQASTVREIQMLSLPITILQVGMFSLSTAAANNPGSSIARIAEWVPFSSPLAMAAHGASDAAIWPHIVALVWQAAWVALIVWLSVKAFRSGVLGGGWRFFRKRNASAIDSNNEG